MVKAGADEDGFDVSGEGSRGVSRGIGRRAAAREGVDGGGEEEILAAFVREAEPAADALVGGGARVVVVRGEVDEVHPGVVGDRELLERVALVVGRGPRGRGEERVGDEQVAPAEATILARSTPRLQGRAVAGTRGDGDASADARRPGIRHPSAGRRNATTRRDGRHCRESTPRASRIRRAGRHPRPPSRDTPRARRGASRRCAWRRRVRDFERVMTRLVRRNAYARWASERVSATRRETSLEFHALSVLLSTSFSPPAPPGTP